MNKKLLATAVAASLVAPAAVNAAEVYGRVNNAIAYQDTSLPGTATELAIDEKTWDVQNISSRLGLKGSSDLENGMTVSGRYEFATDTVIEGVGIKDTRLGWVAIGGDWGTIKIGNQWSAFFGAVGTYMSPTFSLGFYLGSSAGTQPLRTSNTISYANTFGPVSLQIDGRMNASATDNIEKNISQDRGKDVDGLGIGLSFAATDAITIGFAWDGDFYDNDPVTGADRDDTDRLGLGGSFGFGDQRIDVAWYSIDTGNQPGQNFGPLPRDDDVVSIYYHGTWGMNKLSVGWLGTEVSETGVGNLDATQIFIGFYHKMGGGFQTYLESAFVDVDNTTNFRSGDITHIIVGMRYDF